MMRLIELKDTFVGKVLAVFVSILLATSLINVAAFANGQEGNSTTPYQESIDDRGTNASDDASGDTASDQAGDTSATQSAEETTSAATEQQSGDSADNGAATQTQGSATNGSSSDNGQGGSSQGDQSSAAQGDEDNAQSQDSEEVTVQLKLDNASLMVKDQTIASDKTSVKVDAQEKLEFKAVANDGYELDTVKAKSNDAEIQLTEKSGAEDTYVVDAANVADGLEIDVTTKAVESAEEEATEEGTEEGAEESATEEGAEVESASAAPAMLSIKAVEWGKFGVDVVCYDENMLNPFTSATQLFPGGVIADHAEKSITVNDTTYDFVGAYVNNNKIEFAGSNEDGTYYAVSAQSGIASLLDDKDATIELRYQEHVDRHGITYDVIGIDNGADLVSGPENVISGGSFDFTVKNVYGYTVQVTANDQVITGSNEVYTVSNVNDDVTVNVQYTANSTYDFTVEPSARENVENDHGLIDDLDNQYGIQVGQDLTFTIQTKRNAKT